MTQYIDPSVLWCRLVHSIDGRTVFPIPRHTKEYVVVRTPNQPVYIYCPLAQTPHYHALHTHNDKPYNEYIAALGPYAFLETPLRNNKATVLPCEKIGIGNDQTVLAVTFNIAYACAKYCRDPQSSIAVKITK